MRTIDNIKNLPNEEWRAVEGYKGKYLVSNMGRVKSLKHANARLLTAFENNKGYLRVCLCENGQGKHFLVSRLVASAFCENDDPENKTTIDHLNHNRLDNRACNL
ncbi:MAG: hypothetical protein IKB72_04695 [Ruminococcus sp.]|nr:hypothetical protein [Ruminococcus sp.]